MTAAPTPATPATEALLGGLADRPGATATELAQAAGIGRSTACGCQIFGHLRRPAHIHGSAHRVDLVGQPFQAPG